MIKPSDAIKTLADDYFKKSEKEFEKILNEKRMRDYINYIFAHHVDADSVLKDIEAYKNKMTKEEDFSKHMNKPTKAIKIFYSQPMHDKTEEEIKDKIDRLDNYIYGILRYSGFKETDLYRIEIIDNLHHEGLDADAGRLRHLGASIQLMEDADLVIFDKDWDKAKGCTIEKAIVSTYLSSLWLDAGKDNFPMLLSHWFERFLEREKDET